MKRFSVLFFATLLMALVYQIATGGMGQAPDKMPEDTVGRVIQDIAPLPSKDVSLTGVSQTVNLTGDTKWKCNSSTGGIFRVMTSATKIGIAHKVPTDQWYGETVNHKSVISGAAFLNISGATGTCRRQ